MSKKTKSGDARLSPFSFEKGDSRASPMVDPFPQPSGLEKVLLKELVRCAKACYDRGWSHGTAGNFSLRGRRGIIWQSPSGLNKGELNPAQFIPMELSTARVIWPVKVKPSAEMPMHLGVYRAVPEIGRAHV